MKSFVIAVYRSVYIPFILSTYLALPYFFKKSYKKRLVTALEKCGPVFIKCGQSISLKPYLFSRETIEACNTLQDRVSYKSMNLKKEMGVFYNDFVFESELPIASGSIASVFKAREFQSNEYVAIKVLKPNVENVIKADILLLKFVSYFLEFLNFFKRLKLRAIVATIEETLKNEVDFTKEAENLYKIKMNSILNYEKVKTPRLFSKYTSKNLLVTEFVDGAPLSNIEKIKSLNLDTYKICTNLIEIYLKQVYVDGFFHADFHPGNIFVNSNYQITLIDFGIVSSISYEDRLIIAKILNGFLLKDYQGVLEAHLEGGYIKNQVNLEEFKSDLVNMGENFIHSGIVKNFSISGILMELFRVMEVYKIDIKEDLLLLYKTIFFVEAVVTRLHPSYNIWATIKPWMQDWRKKNLNLKTKVIKFISNFLQNFESFIKL